MDKKRNGLRLVTNNCNHWQEQTAEQWIEAAKRIHGSDYDYSLVKAAWRGRHAAIPLTCRKCNRPFDTNINHARNVKSKSNVICPCRRPRKISSRRVSRDTIDYRLLLKHGTRFRILTDEILRLDDPIDVLCIAHDRTFGTTTASLLESDNGCADCPQVNQSRAHVPKNIDEIIAKKVAQLSVVYADRGFTYDNAAPLFKQSKGRKLTITCPTHGDFPQGAYPSRWIGCPHCNILVQHSQRLKFTSEQFVELAAQTTLGYYDLSRVAYRKMNQAVTVGCPVHGFRPMMPETLLRGGGCALCSAAENRWYWDRYAKLPTNVMQQIRGKLKA